MSIVGPRPQLVRDMGFMTTEQRKRHYVKQGLTGLAQVNGRNFLPWPKRLELDVQYVENVSFLMDCKIIKETIFSIIRQKDIAVDTDKVEGNLAELRNGKEI